MSSREEDKPYLVTCVWPNGKSGEITTYELAELLLPYIKAELGLKEDSDDSCD